MRVVHLGRARLIAVAAVSVLVVGGGVAFAAPLASTPVNCTIDANVLTCPLPEPQATTVTETATVTAPPSTVTETVNNTTTETVTNTVTSTTTAPPVTVTVTAPPTTTTTTTPTTTTTTTTPPGACPVTGTNKPGASDGKGGCFPGPGNTGVPAGQTLTAWTGSTTFSTANLTVYNRTFTGRVRVQAANVSFFNSRFLGGLTVTGSANVTDSYIASGDGTDKAADISNTKTLRVEIDGKGGNSAGWCATNCQMTDSWMHISARRNATDHNSGWRMRQNGTYTHNTISCEVASTGSGGGCSAALTGYGDFEPVINNTMSGNLFVASTQQSFCAYGGSSAGKPYTSGAHDNKFLNNVFQRGTNGRCGAYDPIGDYDLTKPGNTMSGNVWDNGGAVTAADVN